MEIFRVCILSNDALFSSKMAEYFLRKSRILLQVETRAEYPEEAMDVLLIDSAWDQKNAKCMLEEGKMHGKCGVIYLSDISGGINRVQLKCYRVSRYLSCRDLLELVEKICLIDLGKGNVQTEGSKKWGYKEGMYPEKGEGGLVFEHSAKGEYLKREGGLLIGVYSPVGRCGKTSFSICLQQLLRKRGKAVFLTLDHYQEWFRDPQNNLAGLVFEVSRYDVVSGKQYEKAQGEEVFLKLDQEEGGDAQGSLFEKYTREKEGITYVPVPEIDSDLYDITASKLLSVISVLRKSADYLILDFAGLEGAPWDVAEQCDFLFIPGMHDSWSEKLVLQFRNELKLQNGGSNRDGMQKERGPYLMEVILPSGIRADTSGNYYAELKWSPMGTKASELLREVGIL